MNLNCMSVSRLGRQKLWKGQRKGNSVSQKTLEKMFWLIFPSIRLSENACSALPKKYTEHLPNLGNILI